MSLPPTPAETPPPLPGAPRARATPRRRALLGLAGFAALVLLFKLRPPATWPFWPRCLLHDATGLHCPGCGLTRAASAALRGDWIHAAAHHPLAALLVPPAFAYAAFHAAYAIARNRVAPLRLPDRTPWIFAGLVLAFGVARNLPGVTCLGP